jgi:hypothetical protein
MISGSSVYISSGVPPSLHELWGVERRHEKRTDRNRRQERETANLRIAIHTHTYIIGGGTR